MNSKKERIFIYRIYFPESDKCYIGQTNNLCHRMEQHFKTDSLVGKAMQKYNDWFGHIFVLHTCHSRDEANRIEIEEIRNFNSVSPNGYNLTAGGDGMSGWVPSDETRKKISDTNKRVMATDAMRKRLSDSHKNPSAETRARLSELHKGNKYCLGRKVSDETRKKLSESHIGKKQSDEQIAKRVAKLKNPSVETRDKMRASAMGNKRGLGYKHTKEQIAKGAASRIGKPRPDVSKRMLKNNPMSDPIANAKHWYKRYKKMVKKLELEQEQELNNKEKS